MRSAFCALVLATLWTAPTFAATDCSKGSIPAGPLKGTINGAAFALDSVTLDPNDQRTQNDVAYDEYHIYLNGKGGAVFDVTAMTVKGKLPDGRTFGSGLDGDEPLAGPGSTEIQGWSITDDAKNLEINFYDVEDGSLQLVFGRRSGKALPVQIHFCAPSKNSEIGGSFIVPLK